MSIDINKLSSDELFELARQRKQEEEKNDARKAAIVVMKNRRKQLEAEHANALATVDANIRGLHEQRAQVIIQHKTAVDQIDRQLADLTRQVRQAEAQAAKLAHPADVPGAAAYADAILAALDKRADISESLLKEQLRTAGLDTKELRRHLEQLVREGRLVHRGAGNYALGRRR